MCCMPEHLCDDCKEYAMKNLSADESEFKLYGGEKGCDGAGGSCVDEVAEWTWTRY